MAYKLANEQRAWDKNMHEATPGSDVRNQCARAAATHVDDSFQYGQDFIKPGNFEDNNQPKVIINLKFHKNLPTNQPKVLWLIPQTISLWQYEDGVLRR